MSLIEIMYPSERGRIPLDLEGLTSELGELSNYCLADIDPEIVRTALSVHDLELHDRIIVATAKHYGVPILTSDETIRRNSRIEVIWS
jgi:predicted nucleic acid-binding protein